MKCIGRHLCFQSPGTSFSVGSHVCLVVFQVVRWQIIPIVVSHTFHGILGNQWCPEVKVGYVNCNEPGSYCGYNAVEENFCYEHICCGCGYGLLRRSEERRGRP